MDNRLSKEVLNGLYVSISACFSLNDIVGVCWDLGIDYDEIIGTNKETKIKNLIDYFVRRNRLQELISYCVAIRPNATWPQASEALQNLTCAPSVYKILFMSSDPLDEPRLRVGEELREIQEKLQLSRLRANFVLSQRLSTRSSDIIQALLDEEPFIVHFSGHGSSNNGLCFEDEQGHMMLVSPEALSNLFKLVKNNVKCVILNACFSANQANSIAEHIDYVIGINEMISDKSAIAFAVGFYQSLGSGKSIPEAFEFGKSHISIQGGMEHDYLTIIAN
jgi:hypothetical protein